MNEDIISATAPLDLGQYRTTPPPDPKLRRSLVGIGGRISLMMEVRDKMPEAIAKETGLPLTLIEQVRAGNEPDITVRTLASICAALGCPFQFVMAMPNPGQPPSAD